MSAAATASPFPTEVIEKHLKKTASAKIPLNEQVILSAVNKGVPVVASRDRSKSPVKELLDFCRLSCSRL